MNRYATYLLAGCRASMSTLLLALGLALLTLNPAFGQPGPPDLPDYYEAVIPSQFPIDTDDAFGQAVAIDGDYAIVGAPFYDGGLGPAVGHAAIYRRDPLSGRWQLMQELPNGSASGPGSGLSAHFGASVAIRGDFAFVGAPGEDWPDAGRVMVFEREPGVDPDDPGQWNQVHVIDAEIEFRDELGQIGPEIRGMQLGASLALGEDAVVIGAPGYADGQGGAYVFEQDASSGAWNLAHTFIGLASSASFGAAVAFDGTRVVIGAPASEGDRGQAYFYANIGGTWQEQEVIQRSPQAEGYLFGAAVALDGEVALVGAPYQRDFSGTPDRGAVFTYAYDGTGWEEDEILFSPDASQGTEFGRSIALRDSLALIGSRLADHGGPSDLNAGEVFVYKRTSNGSWATVDFEFYPSDGSSSQVATELRGSESRGNALFGSAIGFDGTFAVIGAPGNNATAIGDGSDVLGLAYAYSLTPQPPDPFTLRSEPFGPTHLAWERPTDVGEIDIRRYVLEHGPETAELLATVPGTARSYSDPDVPWDLDLVYCLTVRYTFNDHAVASPEQCQVRPALSVNLSATDGLLEDRVVLTWNYIPDEAALYRVERDGVVLSYLASEDTTYTDYTARHDQAYTYCVSILPSSGGTSRPACATGRRVMAAPTEVDASDGLLDSYVRITWRDVSEIEAGYRIYRDGAELATVAANRSVYRDETAEPGMAHTYTYCVAAYDAEDAESSQACDAGWRGEVLPPRNVVASDGGYADFVQVTWAHLAQARTDTSYTYTVYRAETSSPPTLLSQVEAEGAAASIAFNDSSATSGVLYTYCVATVASDGTSESTQVCDNGIRDSVPPPSNVVATVGTRDDGIAVQWDAYAGEPSAYTGPLTGYRILRNTGSTPNNPVQIGQVAFNVGTYLDQTAADAVTYTYCVVAYSEGGAASDSACTTGQRSPVLAPTGVAATDGTHEDRVVVAWTNASSKAALFKIYRNDNLIKTQTAAVLTYTDEAIVPGQRYTYCVRTATAQNVTSANTCDEGHRTIQAPTAVSATDDAHEDRVVVSWQDHSAIEKGYRVYRRDLSASDSTLIATTKPNVTQVVDQAAQSNVSYRYSVVAYDDAGTSAVASDEGRRTLEAPTRVEASDGTLEDKVVITWKDNSRYEEAYVVLRDGATIVCETAKNTQSCEATSETVGVTHTYRVHAAHVFATAGDGSPIYGLSPGNEDTGFSALLPPTSVNASDTYADRVVVTWVPQSTRATGYRITRAGQQVADAGANETTYTFVFQGSDGFTKEEWCIRTLSTGSPSEPACDLGQRVPPPSGGGGPTVKLTNKLLASGGSPNDSLGSAVDLDGSFAILGADLEDDARGAAYLMEHDGTAWHEVKKLTAPARQNQAYFGVDADVSGDYAIVGAFGEGTFNFGDGPEQIWSGRAYIYHRNEGGANNWGYVSTIELERSIPETAVGDLFGWSVSLDGNYAVVGAPSDPEEPEAEFQEQGHVSIFKRDGNQWNRQIAIPFGNYTSQFGFSVDISGNWVIASAPGHNDHRGLVYFFSRSGDTWAGRTNIPGTEANGALGSEVSIDGAYAIAGSDGYNGGQGAVFIYRNDDYKNSASTWTQATRIDPPPGVRGFGWSVSLKGRYALVGAYDENNRADPGAAFLLRRDGDRWVLESQLAAGDPTPDDRFGFAVAVDGPFGFVGAPGDNSDGPGAGAVYAYTLALPPGAVAASDGTYDDHVRLSWTDHAPNEDGFKIYRDGTFVDEVLANVTSFSDYNSTPGGVHRYCVTTFIGTRESDPTCDLGRRLPNGVIAGRVVAGTGSEEAGVSDVAVCLDPSPNQALLFDGVAGFVEIPDPDGALNMPAGQDFTMSAWVHVGSGGQTVFSKGATPIVGYELYIDDQGDLHARMKENGIPYDVSTPIQPGWHHVAWVRAGTTLRLLIDGVVRQVATNANHDADLANSSSFRIGSGPSGGYFKGQIDEVRIWHEARTEAEIQAQMRATLDGTEAGLVGYYPLNQGHGQFAVDYTEGSRYGTLNGGVYWTDQAAPLDVCALSDSEGNFSISDLRYGLSAADGSASEKSTEFVVTPSREGRNFDPAFSRITLSEQSPVQNQLSFRDVSSPAISGTVTFDGVGLGRDGGAYSCALDSVSIALDGEHVTVTDQTGHYAVATLVGRHTIKPTYDGITFAPPSVTDLFQEDATDVNFLGTTRRTLSGRVGGGCDLSIGTFTLKVTAKSACSQPIEYLYTVTHPQGTFEIANLPPLLYDVEVEAVAATDPRLQASIDAYFADLGPVEVDLRHGDDDLDLIYRAPLRIDIAGLESYVPTCSSIKAGNQLLPPVPLLQQGPAPIALTIEVNEDYGPDGLCPVNTGTVTIFDEIADVEDAPVELALVEGRAEYITYANTPSVAQGRMVNGVNRSYQKSLTAVADVEARSLTATEWAVVEGHRPREGTYVSYTTEEMPMLILRDPPGDGSYSFVEKGSTACASVDWRVSSEVTLTEDIWIKAGLKFEKGIGFSTETKSGVESNINLELRTSHEETSAFQVCTTFEETYATSASPVFVGAEADVFIGAALNVLFAKTDVIEVETGGEVCTLDASESVAIGADEDAFETTYLYTQSHIKNGILPRLEQTVAQFTAEGNSEAATYQRRVDTWKKHLALNQQLKSDAETDIPRYLHENLSFSAGADYSYTHTSDTTWAYTWENTIGGSAGGDVETFFEEIGTGIRFKTGLNVDVDGCAKAIPDPHGFNPNDPVNDACGTADSTHTMRVGYVLTDDDLGDFLTLDIRDDPTFNTPVFKLRSGTSSCPFEPGTQGRDLAQLGINPPHISAVAPGEPATFTLTLTNDSQSGEAREYHLRSVSTQNPGGALMLANGSAISGGMSFFLDAQQSQEVTLQVDRGPTRYTYDSLAVMMYAPCEYQNWENNAALQRADTVYFSVDFEAACSPVSLHLPSSNWVVNADSTGKPFPVIFADLNLERVEELAALGVQYRKYGANAWGEWQEGFRVERENLGDPVCDAGERDCSFYKGDWFFAPEEGLYQLRAYSMCSGGIVYSEPVAGTVDVQPPVIFGTPEPADEELALGDEMSLTFNEPIQCSDVETGGAEQNVWLRYADGAEAGTEIPLQMLCADNTVILQLADGTPWGPLEGRLLEATVQNIPDRAGNELEAPVSWSFTVRRSAFGWSPSIAHFNVPPDAEMSLTATLVNGRAQPVAYDLVPHNPSGLPFTFTRYDGDTPTSDTVELTATLFDGQLVAGGTVPVQFLWPGAATQGVYRGTIAAHGMEGSTDIGESLVQIAVNVSCMAPTWSVNPAAFEHTMSIMAELVTPSGPSSNPNDLVAAFVGSELRGVASVQNVASSGDPLYRVPLVVYSNEASGEQVTFQVWDDASCALYTSTNLSLIFQADEDYGTPQDPIALSAPANGNGPLEIPLNEGWTWFSTNRDEANPAINAVLDGLLTHDGDIIKDLTRFSLFDAGSDGWVGLITDVGPATTYKIHLTEASTLLLPGTPVDVATTEVDVTQGWTWLPYLPQEPYPLDHALQAFNAQNNDVIKDQASFAQYFEGIWFGSLQEMKPGGGYLLKAAQAGSFAYPSTPPAVATAKVAGGKDGTDNEGAGVHTSSVHSLKTGWPKDVAAKASANKAAAGPDWSVEAAAFEHSMSVVARLEVEGAPLADPNALLAAFAGEDVRGVGQPQYVAALDRYLVFLTAHSNEAEGETLTLRFYDAAQNVIHESSTTLTFEADAVIGSVADPLIIAPAATGTAAEGALDVPTAYALDQNYPNPFNPATTIRYALPEAAHVELVVYDVRGREVARLEDRKQTAGRYEVRFDAQRLPSGVYFYRLRAGSFSTVHKMVLLK